MAHECRSSKVDGPIRQEDFDADSQEWTKSRVNGLNLARMVFNLNVAVGCASTAIEFSSLVAQVRRGRTRRNCGRPGGSGSAERSRLDQGRFRLRQR